MKEETQKIDGRKKNGGARKGAGQPKKEPKKKVQISISFLAYEKIKKGNKSFSQIVEDYYICL